MKDFIETFVGDFLAVPENNNLGPGTTGRAWEGFLVGYSAGTDVLYPFLKEHIGEFHWTPAEAFALGCAAACKAADAAAAGEAADAAPAGEAADAAPGARASIAPELVPADELTVISWALCQTEAAKQGNRRETRFPSEPWARSRVYGQHGNRALHRALVKMLAEQGCEAVAPGLLPEAVEHRSPAFGSAFAWSERHVAYISGLGTFGLCGGLITERGQAVRLGSIVVRAKLPPTPRPYNDPFAYCLYFSHGSCDSCVDRCPVGSVNVDGRDKDACLRHLETATAEYVSREFGFDGYGCGLCQTGVPCESRIPEQPAAAERAYRDRP